MRRIIFVLILAGAFFFSLSMLQKDQSNDGGKKLLLDRAAPLGLRFKEQKEQDDHYVQSQMDVCFKQGKDVCYRTVADLLFIQFGLKESLNFLAANEHIPAIFARCHQVTHYLSRSEYERTKNLPAIMPQCNFTCHGGCYHGAIEEYLLEKQALSAKNDEAVRQEIRTVCGSSKDYQAPLTFRECVHGLGHGAMYLTDSDVFKSLSLCDALTTEEERNHCYSGVFMENSSSSTNLDHPSRFIDPDDPFFPCNELTTPYLPMCYRYQSSYFALLTDHDWGKTADLCLQVPEPYRSECFMTIGTNQVGFTQDMKVMSENCHAMPAAFRDNCIAGVVISLTGRYVGDAEKVVAFCESVWSDGQGICYSQFGRSIRDWAVSEDQRIQLCDHSASSDGKKRCWGEERNL